jgi:hypothetical protein
MVRPVYLVAFLPADGQLLMFDEDCDREVARGARLPLDLVRPWRTRPG